MSGPTTSASLACLLVTRRPIVSPPFGPSVGAVDVRAGIEEQPRDVGAIGRQRRPRAIEPAAIGIAGNMMEERRAREVVVGRIEVGSSVHQRGIGRKQAAQPVEVASIHGCDGLLEARVRTERRDRIGELDALFELRPAVEAIFPRDDELRIGQREAPSREPPVGADP